MMSQRPAALMPHQAWESKIAMMRLVEQPAANGPDMLHQGDLELARLHPLGTKPALSRMLDMEEHPTRRLGIIALFSNRTPKILTLATSRIHR